MSLDILGDGFDLHGGGNDLVFPHHTNERAESLAAGREFARYWVHNAMINIGGEKMSKSLNNFTTVRELLDEDPLNARALRVVFLQTHYRKNIEINTKVMSVARETLKGIDSMVRRADNAGIDLTSTDRDGDAIASFRASMDHDFGTPDAMATVFELVRRANVAIDNDSPNATALSLTAIELSNAVGLNVATAAEARHDDDDIDALVAERSAAKAAKDFAAADQIRDDLQRRGVTVEDTATGVIWYRS